MRKYRLSVDFEVYLCYHVCMLCYCMSVTYCFVSLSFLDASSYKADPLVRPSQSYCVGHAHGVNTSTVIYGHAYTFVAQGNQPRQMLERPYYPSLHKLPPLFNVHKYVLSQHAFITTFINILEGPDDLFS